MDQDIVSNSLTIGDCKIATHVQGDTVAVELVNQDGISTILFFGSVLQHMMPRASISDTLTRQ